jgi:predicted NUDIX family NTP pyrophosphohydrolase
VQVRTSAGVLLYRRRALAGGDPVEVFLVHPGGPFFARRDDGSWGIPKGEYGPDEEPRTAALREFTEETGFVVPADAPMIELDPVRLKGGKQVRGWAVEHDVDPDLLVSNTCEVTWPPGTGRRIEIPEVDRGGWFGIEAAATKISAGQRPMIDDLLRRLADGH